MKKQKLVIVGGGGFGREVYQLIQDINTAGGRFEVAGYVSRVGGGVSLLQKPLLGDDEWALNLAEADMSYALAIGRSTLRESIGLKYEASHLEATDLIHPSAVLGNTIKRGEGSIICAGCILTTDIELGDFVNLNLQCTIGHDCVLGDYVTLHPGVRLSGNVWVGKGTEIGTGAIVLPGVRIGAYCKIGAGAVVTKNCESGKTYVGVPARVIR